MADTGNPGGLWSEKTPAGTGVCDNIDTRAFSIKSPWYSYMDIGYMFWEWA